MIPFQPFLPGFLPVQCKLHWRIHRPRGGTGSRPAPTPDGLLLDMMIVDPTLTIAHDEGRSRSGSYKVQAGDWSETSVISVMSQARGNSSVGSAT